MTKQAFCLLKAETVKILLWGYSVFLEKYAVEIRLADVQLLCKLAYGGVEMVISIYMVFCSLCVVAGTGGAGLICGVPS